MENQLLSKFDITKDGILQIIKPNENDIVYLSGSIAEGFGNEGSDLDIYIITYDSYGHTDETLPYQIMSYGREYTFTGQKILLSGFYIQKDVFSMLLKDIEFKIRNKQIMDLSNKLIELYHRIYKGIPLHNESGFNQLKANLNTDLFIKNLCLNRLVYSENRHNDAVGALKSADIWTAYLSAKISLEKSIDGLLISKGETNPSDKWLFRRLFSLYSPEDEWVKEFMNCYMGSKELSNLKDSTVEMLRLANRIRLMGYESYNSLNQSQTGEYST